MVIGVKLISWRLARVLTFWCEYFCVAIAFALCVYQVYPPFSLSVFGGLICFVCFMFMVVCLPFLFCLMCYMFCFFICLFARLVYFLGCMFCAVFLLDCFVSVWYLRCVLLLYSPAPICVGYFPPVFNCVRFPVCFLIVCVFAPVSFCAYYFAIYISCLRFRLRVCSSTPGHQLFRPDAPRRGRSAGLRPLARRRGWALHKIN